MNPKIDILDAKIMHYLRERKAWKKKVWEELDEDVSFQTIARRIENLQRDGYLNTHILDVDEKLNRDKIIGYSTSDTGIKVLEETYFCASCGKPEHKIVCEHQMVRYGDLSG